MTPDPSALTPVWSPDGSQIVFSSRGKNRGLFKKASNGAGEDQLLFKEFFASASDWSRDSRFLLLTRFVDSNDLWVLPTDGGDKPFAYLATPASETHGKFFPDPAGTPRWVAYASDESGKVEVYVSAFPDPSRGKSIVSSGGGAQPRWSRDGKELFYIAPDNTLMSVAVSIVAGRNGPTFKPSSPKPLFKAPLTRPSVGLSWGTYWDVAPDGRFLMNIEPEQIQNQPSITVVLNWQAGLKK